MVQISAPTSALDLGLPAISPVFTLIHRRRTAADHYRRKLPAMSPRQTGPRPPLRFRDPASIYPKPPRKPPIVPVQTDTPTTPRADTEENEKKTKKQPSGPPSIPAMAKSNIFCYLTTSSLPIPLFPKKFDGKVGYEQDLYELHMLAEVFGETGVWFLDVEDACCRYCVERMRYHDEHHLERIRLRTKYLVNFFMRPDCGHRFVFPLKEDADGEDMLNYDVPLRRLTHHFGLMTTNRIRNVFLRVQVLDINTLCSAFDIITKTLTNLQTITVLLPPPPPATQPFPRISVHRLWRAFQLLETHLPAENTIKIEGIYEEGYERLELKWRDARKTWWYKHKSTRVLHRRTYRSLDMRSDLCEDMGYPLPWRCPDYPTEDHTVLGTSEGRRGRG